jgi:hypothetical protein
VAADMNLEEEWDTCFQYENLPLIWGIKSQMRQLFQNLLSNSLKFRKKDVAPLIKVYANEVIVNHGEGFGKKFSRVIIEDNGIGFDPKFAQEIFIVFKRLHSFHEFPGSGVGLSICKKIVDHHNGFISAESQPGIGSKFLIDFPVIRVTENVLSSTLEKDSLHSRA